VEEGRLAELERKVGRQAMLAACRGAAETAGVNYSQLVYRYLEKEMSLATPMPLERLCHLSGLRRAGFYRWRESPEETDTDIELRNEIQQIALEWPSYGWRRVRNELGRRRWVVNHKRVRRIMREDNLLCLRRRRFIATTDSNPRLPV